MVRDGVWGKGRGRGRVTGRGRVGVCDRLWVRVTEGLVRAGDGVGRPIGKGIRIAIQASSSLLLPDPRMSAAKAALVGGAAGLG